MSSKEYILNQDSSATYVGTLQDINGPIPLSVINTLTLTLYDKNTGAFINNREEQDVLNANDVTVGTTDGKITWNIQPADNPIVNSDIRDDRSEVHIALFEFGYKASDKGNKSIVIRVNNIDQVENV